MCLAHLRRDTFALAADDFGLKRVGRQVRRGHERARSDAAVSDVEVRVSVVAAVDDAPRVLDCRGGRAVQR